MNGIDLVIATIKSDMAISSNPEITLTFAQAEEVLGALETFKQSVENKEARKEAVEIIQNHKSRLTDVLEVVPQSLLDRAYNLGVCGANRSEFERLLFDSYLDGQGPNWFPDKTWNSVNQCYMARETRIAYAVWQDRGALTIESLIPNEDWEQIFQAVKNCQETFTTHDDWDNVYELLNTMKNRSSK